MKYWFQRQFGIAVLAASFISCFPPVSCAQDDVLDTGLLEDRTGDGLVSIGSFGDSVTYGVGDGTQPGDELPDVPVTDGSLGYPQRLRELLGMRVVNQGVPGEELANLGIARFPSAVVSSKADVYTIFEGSNDARQGVSSEEYGRLIQRAINVVRIFGKAPVIATLPKPCCEHGFFSSTTEAYSSTIRRIAAVNDIPVVDLERAWRTTCVNQDMCELFNIPEGLHPNSKGYDVIAQTFSATFLGIDVFAPGGAKELADVLGKEESQIVVKPEATPTPKGTVP